MATCHDFGPHVGDTFASTLGDGTRLDLELTECEAMPDRPGWAEGFTLLFTEPTGVVVDQQQHHLAHPQLGELTLFLVPIGQDESGTAYEAVVSRVPGTTP